MWTPLKHLVEQRRLRRHLKGVRQLLDELDAEYGPIPDDVKEKAKREWDEIERRSAEHRGR